MNRRDFIKNCAFSLGALSVLGNRALAQGNNTRPNIVVFLVDDMGWQDTSVPFHTEKTPFNELYHTPNMQRLADEGMKFTQAYACAICSPTRISFMTGLNAARHRVTTWTLPKDSPTDAAHSTLNMPKWNYNGLAPEPGINNTIYAKSLPEYLQQAGYYNIHIGKAHLGAIGTPGEEPLNLGFDVNVAGHAAGAPGSFYGIRNFSSNSVWDVPGMEEFHGQDIYLTEALTIKANEYIDKSVEKKQPFFLHMSHYAVHTPIQKDDRFYQKYVDKGLDNIEASYASMVEGMDKSLGDIMDNIEKHKMQDNTIILFVSDNGGLSVVARGGQRHTHNKPLSSGKGSAHEGGTRVPMLAKWPGKTKAGSKCEVPIIIEDFFPTILDLAGVKNYQQIGGKIDGISFVDLLQGKPADKPDRCLYWHQPNNWGQSGPGLGPHSAIRQGDWKLIYYHTNQSYELFNLKDDIGETKNLAASKKDKLKDLALLLKEYLVSVDAQMPTFKETGKAVPWPGLEKNAITVD